MTTVLGMMLQESSALAWQPSSAVAGAVTVLSALLFWRFVKWGEANRAEQLVTVPVKRG